MKQKVGAWRSCAHIVQIYTITTVCVSLYIYKYVVISYILQLGVWSIRMIRSESSGWIIIFGASSEVVMSGFAYPILADSVWGDGLLAGNCLLKNRPAYLFIDHPPYWEVYLTPWWSIGSDFFIWYHTIELQYIFIFYIHLYTTQYISHILMTVFWYAEATTWLSDRQWDQ